MNDGVASPGTTLQEEQEGKHPMEEVLLQEAAEDGSGRVARGHALPCKRQLEPSDGVFLTLAGKLLEIRPDSSVVGDALVAMGCRALQG